MNKKWKNIDELSWRINEDSHDDDYCLSQLEGFGKELRCLCYAPNIGYYTWIFSYKGTLVALFDGGNGWWDLILP